MPVCKDFELNLVYTETAMFLRHEDRRVRLQSQTQAQALPRSARRKMPER